MEDSDEEDDDDPDDEDDLGSTTTTASSSKLAKMKKKSAFEKNSKRHGAFGRGRFGAHSRIPTARNEEVLQIGLFAVAMMVMTSMTTIISAAPLPPNNIAAGAVRRRNKVDRYDEDGIAGFIEGGIGDPGESFAMERRDPNDNGGGDG